MKFKGHSSQCKCPSLSRLLNILTRSVPKDLMFFCRGFCVWFCAHSFDWQVCLYQCNLAPYCADWCVEDMLAAASLSRLTLRKGPSWTTLPPMAITRIAAYTMPEDRSTCMHIFYNFIMSLCIPTYICFNQIISLLLWVLKSDRERTDREADRPAGRH